MRSCSKLKDKCKHEFTHGIAEGWWGYAITIYCKHCGILADESTPERRRIKKLKKLFNQ